MAKAKYSQFIRFLQEDLAISSASIAFAERICSGGNLQKNEAYTAPLPMVLWQYGLVTIDQLDRIFDWLETA
ncbi:MAG TPA: DUF2949 domain-containing protein [Oscillatoriaceae cyanobacterium M33_DOE_052]|uniref:DUF2949 domain-containing protein n=1 Tax=Planktothricoides sp. SpSt-374 TaxID=2282167 RepID=A0A7C3ZKF5_9CYAN|nr:DUF2949 domain-containing protein [Oscillatoriaceae cyanobacterium M33_DOE_052]